MERVPSGIAGFDRLVGGGLPAETSLILQGPPGQEKVTFALSFLAEGLRNGGSGLVVVSSQSPESLLRDLRRFGVDVDQVVKEDRLRIVDWFSWSEETVTDVEERGAVVRSSVDLTNAGVAVSRGIAALQGNGPRRAVVEMLSPAMNVYEAGQVYAFAQSTKRKFDRFRFTALFLLENEMHTPAVLTTLHQPFDGVIEIERSRSGDRIVRKIGVLHLKDTTPTSDFIPFEFTEQGIYVGAKAPPPPPPAPPKDEPPVVAPRAASSAPAPHPPESGGNRVRLIMEIARERLKVDPEDGDALFSLAAALATMDDSRGAIQALERLETIDPDYPGLWAFEMKLFARLGDADRWARSRERALAASAEEDNREATPCPFCHAPVATGSAQCPHCMANLREETDILRGLEDLVRATVQDMVQEELGAKPPDRAPAAPEAKPATPEPVETRPCPSCSTPVPSGAAQCPKCHEVLHGDADLLRDLEELVRETVQEELEAKPQGIAPEAPVAARTRRERKVAPEKPVSPLKGLTNGLILKGRRTRSIATPKAGRVNGLRGRTNGLTNGLGRTNGLTNGLGRTNGLTNGLRGRTNGLTNGLGGRTNGLTNGLRGRTNGLTNGLGRTNGLTNGVGRTNGLTNGLAKVANQRGIFSRGGRAHWQRIGLAAALVVLIIVLPLVLFWTGPTVSYPIKVDGQFSDWAGVTKVAALPPQVTPNPDIEITHVAVKDNIDFLAFYLQVLGNATTGGPAPLRITNAFFAFIDTDRSQATGYGIQGIGADRMVQIDTWGGQIVSSSLKEFDQGHGHEDWNGWVSSGSVDTAAAGSQIEFQVPWLGFPLAHGPVNVAFASRAWDGQSDAADVVLTNADPFLLVRQTTTAPQVILSSSADLSRFYLRAVDGDMTVSGLNVTFQGTFSSSAVSAVDLVDETGSVLAETAPAQTVRFDLSSFTVLKDQIRTLAVRVKLNVADGSTIGALLLSLNDVRVASGGVSFQAPATKPDSLAYLGFAPTGPRIDGAFGEWTNVTSSPGGNVQPMWDRDVDLTGYSFMGAGNDTYFMAETAGTLLNGTMIPALNPAYTTPTGNATGNGTTPPPYVPPPVNGTDSLRIFVDADGSASTGYSVGAIGADYLVEVKGKNGVVLSSLAMHFTGANPLQWNWTAMSIAPAAKDRSHLEAALPGVAVSTVSRVLYEITGWNGAYDGSIPARPVSVASAPGLLYAPGAISGIDPTGIIDTTGSLSAIGGPTGRNIFYDGTNFWAFYFDGASPSPAVQYEPSATGLSWVNAKNHAFTSPGVLTVSTWFNVSGSTKNVYVVGDSGTNSRTVDVRNGTISGTTITWGGLDATAVISGTGPGATKSPTITKDSTGYLWVSGLDKEGNGKFNFAAARSTAQNSIAAWNAPQVMNITNSSSSSIQGILVPLKTSGQVYAIWYLNGPIYGRLYSGTAWSGTIDTIATTLSGNLTLAPSAIVDGSGNIDLVYVDSAGAVQFKQRQGSSWGSATSLDSSSGNWYPTITWNNSTGNLYAFWLSSTGQIKAKVYGGASWTSATLEVNTKGKVGLTSVYNVGPTSDVAWAWTQNYCQAGSTTCYDVKFSLYNSTLNGRTIDTTADTSALSYNNQRKVFFDGSYFWTFYYDGTNTVYSYSDSSATTWENPVTQAFTTTNVGNPSVWFYSSGSTKIVYIVGDLVSGAAKGTVNVRRGVISGTTISWGTEASPSMSPTAMLAKVAYIARTANGDLWIVSSIKHNGNPPNLNICAMKSNTADNVSAWTASCPNTGTGFLSPDISNNFIYPTILPLSAGDMYALWYADGSVAGRKYSASNSSWWASNELIATTTAGVSSKAPSAVVDGSGNVDLVYVDTSGAVQFKQRTASWSGATSLDPSAGSMSPTVTLEAGSNNLDVFYVSSTNQVKGQYYNGAWSAITGFIDSSTANKTYLTSVYSVSARSQVAWMWGSGTTSPLEVRIARIPEFEQIVPPIVGTVAIILFVSAKRRRVHGRPQAPSPQE